MSLRDTLKVFMDGWFTTEGGKLFQSLVVLGKNDSLLVRAQKYMFGLVMPYHVIFITI